VFVIPQPAAARIPGGQEVSGNLGAESAFPDYPDETTEAFCAGHTAAFGFFGGVQDLILYDNTKIAVVRILGDGTR